MFLQEGTLPLALEFCVALVAILAAAVLFTNAVEILGGRFNLGTGAVGSVLAAVGTALPETMIPVVAILAAAFAGEGGEAAGEIGIGAILVLVAIAIALTVLEPERRSEPQVDADPAECEAA